MQKSTGQITVFAILGIIILFVMVFLLYAASQINREQLRPQTELSAQAILEASTLEEYTRLCLREATREGLKLIGEQGGVIYDFQIAGTGINLTPHNTTDFSQSYTVLDEFCQKTTDAWTYNYTFILPFEHAFAGQSDAVLYNLSYAVQRRDRNPKDRALCLSGTSSMISYMPPIFPNPKTLSSTAVQESLGIITLPSFCNQYGENAWNLSNVINVSRSWLNNTCEDSYSDDMVPRRRSIQESLRLFVENVTDKCLDLNAIRTNLGYDVDKGDVEASIVLTKDDVSAYIRFPLVFQFSDDLPVTKMLAFSHTEKVRLREVVLAAQRLLNEDNRNIFFDIDYDAYDGNCTLLNGSKSECLPEGINLQNFTHVCENSPLCDNDLYSDVWVVSDNKSLLYDQPYRFMFAVENRFPALEYIDSPASGDDLGFEVNIVAFEDQTIHIDPYAYDPDQDNYWDSTHPLTGKRYMVTTYNYSGWKETADSDFDFEACQNNQVDCINKPWNYTIPVQGEPMNWSTSSSYENTFRNASYHTNKSDTGYHIVNVKVCDDEGLCDWQEIKILIIDSPIPVANGSTFYENIPHEFASIEDPYYVTANDSIASVLTGSNLLYNWYDNYYAGVPPSNEPKLLNSSDDPNKLIEIPQEAYTIEDITSKYFSVDDDVGNDFPTEHVMHLEIVTPQSTVYDNYEVSIYQCLPYHDSEAASYPYHHFEADNAVTSYIDVAADKPFLGNHSCCQADTNWNAYGGDFGKVYSANANNCYEYSSYTGLNGIDPGRFNDVSGAAYTTQNLKLTTISGAEHQISKSKFQGDVYDLLKNDMDADNINDIYQRNYTRACDGTRGNVCNGTIIETIVAVVDCDNLNAAMGQTMHCSGPPTGPAYQYDYWDAEQRDKPECIQYYEGGSPTTFERAVLGIGTSTCAPPTCTGGGYGCANTCEDGECTQSTQCSCMADPCGAAAVCDGRQRNSANGQYCCDSLCSAHSDFTLPPQLGLSLDWNDCNYHGSYTYCADVSTGLFFRLNCGNGGWTINTASSCDGDLISPDPADPEQDLCVYGEYGGYGLGYLCNVQKRGPTGVSCTSTGWTT